MAEAPSDINVRGLRHAPLADITSLQRGVRFAKIRPGVGSFKQERTNCTVAPIHGDPKPKEQDYRFDV
jgi:hypothetical protein